MGRNVGETTGHSYACKTRGTCRAVANRLLNFAKMESSMATDDGEKLTESPDDVGAESEQLSAQHNRAAVAACDLSLLLALSQHSIIPIFSE